MTAGDADDGQARDNVPRKLAWHAAPIVSARAATPRVKSFVLRVGWQHPFRAGQHVDLRLTAPDGYQAQRSYSIASAPEELPDIELLIERLDDGEVSSFFHEVAAPGDAIELRGPIGGPFTWGAADGGPILLVGGGSGVVPLLSMVRHRAVAAPDVAVALVASARTPADAIALGELTRRAATEAALRFIPAFTRSGTVDVPGAHRRRIDAVMLGEALAVLPAPPVRCFVCGSNAFVGAVADLLVAAGVPPGRVRTERFG